MMTLRPLLLLAAACLLTPVGMQALTIELDYTYDTNDFTSGGGTVGFFASNAVAKAALEAAAFDLGNSITSNLAAINVADAQTFSGTSGGTTINFDPQWTFRNPTTGSTVTLNGLNLATNTFRIYVGSQLLGGNTLGQGGHGAFGYSASGSFGGTTSDYVPAISNGVTNTNAMVGRGSAVTIGNRGTPTFNISGTNYASTVTMTYGPTLGNLWFDADMDNSGTLDSISTLNNYWQFNHTEALAQNKKDFYSVALHEMLHTIGFGTADTWNAKVGTDGNANGKNDWTGSNVITLKGSGTDLIDGDSLAHVAEGAMGTRLTGTTSALISAGAQEAVMDPTILTVDFGTYTQSERKILTDLDQAFLQDIGYTTTTAIPEPSTYGLLGAGALGSMLVVRRRRRA